MRYFYFFGNRGSLGTVSIVHIYGNVSSTDDKNVYLQYLLIF